MPISNLDQAYLCRKVVFASIVLCCLLWVMLLNFQIPLKIDLLVSAGEVKKILPIIKSGDINGYKVILDEDSYSIKWLDFSIDKQRLYTIVNKKGVTIFYKQSFWGLGANEIYEISTEREVVFGYDFFVHNHLNSKNKKLDGMPYLLLFCFFCLAFIQLYI